MVQNRRIHLEMIQWIRGKFPEYMELEKAKRKSN
jgi:hypothetical protein